VPHQRAGPNHDGGGRRCSTNLATEHWSLLATRSLTYTEALNRVTIFLAILSGAVIALALVAQGRPLRHGVQRDRDLPALGGRVHRDHDDLPPERPQP
jgi:hypothetical protein